MADSTPTTLERNDIASSSSGPLTAFVSFPSPYTQTIIVKALVSCLSAVSISLVPPSEDDPPQLQWADYDLISFDKPHASPSTHLISSYIYRKALIRKHQLHLTITEYLAKCRHRGVKSALEAGGVPKGWVVDLQFADELDELLMDDLYELAEGMRENEGKEDGDQDKRWYILKPGFADRAQGIRMFSTEDELRAIFESFEPPSSDEDGGDIDGDDNHHPNGNEEGESAESYERRIAAATAKMRLADDGGSDEDEDGAGTGVMTSQLRHFVIQEYMPRPILFDIAQRANEPSASTFQGHKFHLRAYVLLTADYTLYLSHVLLALFSSDAYTHPTSKAAWDESALRPHLTNTCLQADALGQMRPPEELVRLFWELEGMDMLAPGSQGGDGEANETPYTQKGKVDKEWLDRTFDKVGEVIAESVKAGVECGSFGLQLMPNAFEIFGVDLILSYPEPSGSDLGTSTSSGVPPLPLPIVTLLEFNASPDFVQTGDRLQPLLGDMFKGVVHLAIAPFFGIRDRREEQDGAAHHGGRQGSDEMGAGKEMVDGAEKFGWRMIGKGQVRGPS